MTIFHLIKYPLGENYPIPKNELKMHGPGLHNYLPMEFVLEWNRITETTVNDYRRIEKSHGTAVADVFWESRMKGDMADLKKFILEYEGPL